MSSQVANLYIQAEVSVEQAVQMSNFYAQMEAQSPAQSQLGNFYLQYDVDYPRNSLMANAFLQYELGVNPLDYQVCLANFFVQVELHPLNQTPEFGPRLSSET